MSAIPSPGKRRIDQDIIKLIEANYDVQIKGTMNELAVKFHGPKGTPYESGVWRVHVHLPERYPFKSPSIGFMNKIYHPNIDESSGSVCLDVINQTWSALFDLKNVFDTFLPQLLSYPNPMDPLNSEAASLYINKQDDFKKKVSEYVRQYASEEALRELDAHEASRGSAPSSFPGTSPLSYYAANQRFPPSAHAHAAHSHRDRSSVSMSFANTNMPMANISSASASNTNSPGSVPVPLPVHGHGQSRERTQSVSSAAIVNSVPAPLLGLGPNTASASASNSSPSGPASSNLASVPGSASNNSSSNGVLAHDHSPARSGSGGSGSSGATNGTAANGRKRSRSPSPKAATNGARGTSNDVDSEGEVDSHACGKKSPEEDDDLDVSSLSSNDEYEDGDGDDKVMDQ